MADKPTDEPRTERSLSRRDSTAGLASPFGVLDRLADEMDRMLGDFGLGRRWSRPRVGAALEAWAPDVELLQRNNELVVRADLPGLDKGDVKIDVTDDALTIQGERKREHEEEHEGVYRSERSYGSFCRVIPLPEGAITDQAKATFKDGVLEITMPAPPDQVRRGRRLEISGESSKGK
jgi:HSP20 family protein